MQLDKARNLLTPQRLTEITLGEAVRPGRNDSDR